jgi:hypothetical protein
MNDLLLQIGALILIGGAVSWIATRVMLWFDKRRR